MTLDTTERAKAALRQSEARNTAIIHAALDCIVTIDHEDKVLEFNPAAERTFGYRREHVLGRTMAELIIPPSLRERHRRGMARYLASGKGPILDQRIEISALRADGTEFLVELTVTRIPTDGPPLFTAYLRDITERKRWEQRLTIQYTVTRALAESATLTQAGSGILRAICEQFGWHVGGLWYVDKRDNVLRCADVQHLPSVSVPQFEAICHQCTFEPGIGLPGRVWSSGKAAWIPDVVKDNNFPRAPIAAAEGLHGAFGFPIALYGEVLGVIEFYSHDIRQPNQDLLRMMTAIGSQIGQFIERKRAEAALRQSEQRYREVEKALAHASRVATLGQMSASIAHEINQPVTATVTNAQAALRFLTGEPPNLEEVRQALNRIARLGDRVVEVVSRIRALVTKTPPRQDEFEIDEAIDEVISLTHGELVKNGVSLHREFAARLPLVQADRVQLQQVILNLIMNAVEAMGGLPDGQRELWISTKPHGADGILVAVRDSGPGLDPANFNRVFDPFYSTKPGGLGIGLSICRSIVEAHEGRLWVEASKPRGAIFALTLPVTGGRAR